MKILSINSVKSLFSSRVTRVILGTLFIAISAQVQIPTQPVPITLHTAAVLILALAYNKTAARQSVVGFVTLAALGFPVFSGFKSGQLMGPTGGYILGMVVCVYCVTYLREKFGEDSWLKLFAYTIAGSVCIYTVGLSQLSFFVGLDRVLELGLYPFIIPGIAKALFTASSVNILKNTTALK